MIRTSLTVIVLLVLMGAGLTVSTIPIVSATSTNATSTNATSTNATSTNATSTNATSTNATSTNATSTNATSTNASQQVIDQPHFKADLRGIQQFSPHTNASGEAYFRVLDDENIGYFVDVRNISGVSSAIITYWDGNFPDIEIIPLRLAPLEGLTSPGEVSSGTGEGTFGVSNFSERGPVERSIGDFVKNALDGNIYLKITTVQSPLGEIAGKLVPQVQ